MEIEKETRTVIYARSSGKTDKAPPVLGQLLKARSFIREQQIENVGEYVDEGFSGGNWKRPEWNRLVRHARKNYFKLVIVWNQDRLARDTEQFLWFYRKLYEKKIRVYSITEGEISMETVGDRVKNTSLAMAHETFRLITSEKIKRTYARKKEEADNKGVPVVWGRRAIPEKTRQKALELAQERPEWGYRKIGKELGVSHVWVMKVLKEGVK